MCHSENQCIRAPDAKGDVQRGLEVIELCMGAPAFLKGEFTGMLAPALTVFDASAAWRRGRDHAIQLPRHDPDCGKWALPCPRGNAIILEPVRANADPRFR